MVNADNRVLAGVFRLLIEPIFSMWISSSQRGFVKGRSLPENLFDVDHAARLRSLSCSDPALILFDFDAAFTSLSHHFIWGVLAGIGIPPHIIHGIQGF